MASKPKKAVMINKKGSELLEYINEYDKEIRINGKELIPTAFLHKVGKYETCYVFLVNEKGINNETTNLDYLKKTEILLECNSIEEFENIIKTLQQVK